MTASTSSIDSRAALAELLADFAATFGKKIDPRMADVYYRALRPERPSAAELRAAGDDCLRECRFFPRPAELVERVRARRQGNPAAARSAGCDLCSYTGWRAARDGTSLLPCQCRGPAAAEKIQEWVRAADRENHFPMRRAAA